MRYKSTFLLAYLLTFSSHLQLQCAVSHVRQQYQILMFIFDLSFDVN